MYDHVSKDTVSDRDRPGAGSILATMKASSKLASWLEEVNVVTANEVLGQVYDGGHQTLLHKDRYNVDVGKYIYTCMYMCRHVHTHYIYRCT